MGREDDFSWKVSKSVSNERSGKIVAILPEQNKETFGMTLHNPAARAEMEELFEDFKHRIADLISRETNKQ